MYYQVNYETGARRSRTSRLPARAVASQQPAAVRTTTHVLLDGVEGPGHYVGTYLAWGVNSDGWWGEGEVKFYLDGDDRVPDDLRHRHRGLLRRRVELRRPRQGYTEYHYAVPRHAPDPSGPTALYESQQRFGMYRFHLPDPIRFAEELRVDIQALGWRRAAATCRCRTTSRRRRSSTSTDQRRQAAPVPAPRRPRRRRLPDRRVAMTGGVGPAAVHAPW